MIKALGVVLIGTPIMFGLYIIAKDAGYKETFKILGFAIGYTAMVMVGAYLVVVY